MKNVRNFTISTKITCRKMRVYAEFFESTVFRDRGYFRHVSSSIPSGSSRIPTPEGHLSHPRHPQLSVLHRREVWPTTSKDRQAERRAPRENEEGEKRTKSTMNEDTYTLEILFGLGMPIYRLPSSPLRSPPGYVTPRKNAPTVPPDRTDCRG